MVVDAAMNDLLRPALYNGWHEILPVTIDRTIETAICDVVGPVCESADFLGKSRSLRVEQGGILSPFLFNIFDLYEEALGKVKNNFPFFLCFLEILFKKFIGLITCSNTSNIIITLFFFALICFKLCLIPGAFIHFCNSLPSQVHFLS